MKIPSTVTIIDMRPIGQRSEPFERNIEVIEDSERTFKTSEGEFYKSTGWHTESEIRAFWGNAPHVG